MRSAIESAGANAATTPAASRVTPAATTIGIRPTLSTSTPVSGDGRNMAAMCRPITKPTSPRLWPCSRMWTGVMVMIAIMAICVSTMAAAPTTSSSRDVRRGAASGTPDDGVRAASSATRRLRATCKGSGRRKTNSTRPASP